MSFVGRFVLFRSVLYRISEVSLYVPDNHAKLCFLFYTLKLWFSFFLDTTITLGHKFAFSEVRVTPQMLFAYLAVYS